jgi:uncharacterized protein (DUF1684 family)
VPGIVVDPERWAASARDLLELADWRRRIAELYADVRRLAALDPEAAWGLWRSIREALYREHPQSPVPPAERAAFRARFYPYDPAYRLTATVEAPAADGPTSDAAPNGAEGAPSAREAETLALPASHGEPARFRVLATLRVPFPTGERRLVCYWCTGYAGGLFLPFRDATNGRTTYGAGRYLLDAAKGADLGGDPARGTLVLDFNFAYQPSCAFDPRWSCPLAPPANRLDFEIPVGERIR